MENENIIPPSLMDNTLRRILGEMKAKREARRQHLAKVASKAPAWAQPISELEQNTRTFDKLCSETQKLAAAKGYDISGSALDGYSLQRGGRYVLRGRPMFVIVEHLGAQEIWKDFICETAKPATPAS